MVINTDCLLKENNYINIESVKKQIVIGNTNNDDMRHVNGWLTRFNGEYKITAPFTVDKNGVIYQHFNPKYQSEYFKDLEQNKKSIVILLENYGWLENNDENNEFISSLGYIYNKSNVVTKKWREYLYWAPYNKKQIDATIFLVKMLCDEFVIPLTATTHNTKIEGIENFSGVIYKSNIEKYYTDLSPAFDFEYFSNNLNNIVI